MINSPEGFDPIEFKFSLFDQMGYIPHKKQRQFHRSQARIRCFKGAARSGKSYVGSREAIVRAHYPSAQMIWIVAPTYVLAEKIFVEVYDFFNAPGANYPIKESQRHKLRLTFWNGTEIVGKSTENPKSLLGEGVDLMICDEASRIEMEVYTRYLQYRLMTSCGDLALLSTPHGKGNMFHKYYIWGISDDPKYDHVESFSATIYDNPAIDRAEIKRAEETLGETDPIGFRQEMLGEFVDHEGDVFPTYSESEFFVKGLKIDKTLPVHACIDAGTRNPFACMFLQHDPKNNTVRIFDEFYATGRSSLDYALQLKERFKQYNVTLCVVDPREPDCRLIFQRMIPACTFIPGNAETVAFGLGVFRDHFAKNEAGQKYILFDDKCRNLKAEFETIHFPKGNREDTKGPNHALSAIRYYLVTFCNFLKRAPLDLYTADEGNRGSHNLLLSYMNDNDASLVRDNNWQNDVITRPWMGVNN